MDDLLKMLILVPVVITVMWVVQPKGGYIAYFKDCPLWRKELGLTGNVGFRLSLFRRKVIATVEVRIGVPLYTSPTGEITEWRDATFADLAPSIAIALAQALRPTRQP
jgi:hypothetical protein